MVVERECVRCIREGVGGGGGGGGGGGLHIPHVYSARKNPINERVKSPQGNVAYLPN